MKIIFWQPTITASGSNVVYVPRGTEIITLEEVTADFNYSHEANGGCWELNLQMAGDQDEVEDWLQRGLGRHVEACDPDLVVVWDGFVNQVSVSISGLNVDRGPLMEICNRCSAHYARQAVVGSEIVTTSGLTTTVVEQDESQLRYGIFEKIISGGTVWDDGVDNEAEELRDTYLNEFSLPETGKSFSNVAVGQVMVSISCIGYINFLKNYIYNRNTPTTDAVSTPIYDPADADSKLRTVLEADPNNLFTDDTLWHFDTNMILEAQWEDQDSDAYSIIQSMVEKGDHTGNRTLFAVKPGLNLHYGAIPDTLKYKHGLSDPAQDVFMFEGGQEIEPWEVKAGEWLLFTDFLVGEVVPSALREDPRALFIERVGYSTPVGLQLDGGKVHTFKQKLATMGIGI